MKKIVLFLMLGLTLLFASFDFQTATKEELMGIKGIGAKKAQQIIDYREKNKIKDVNDLKNIKGFGDTSIENIKKDLDMKDKKVVSKTELNQTKEIINKK